MLLVDGHLKNFISGNLRLNSTAKDRIDRESDVGIEGRKTEIQDHDSSSRITEAYGTFHGTFGGTFNGSFGGTFLTSLSCNFRP